MAFPSRILAVSFFAVLAGAASGQDRERSRHLELRARASRQFWENSLKIAERAKADGLYREARALLEMVTRGISGRHPYKSKAMNLLAGSWKNRANRGDAAAFRERLWRHFEESADLCFAAYEVAKSNGLQKEAGIALDETLRYYLHHERARRERGEVHVKDFGWVPSSEAESIRRNTFALDGLPEDTSGHDTWKNAWVIRSKHYVVRSDLPLETIKTTLDRLEKLYEEVMDLVKSAFPEPPLPLRVYLFRHRKDFDKARQGLRGYTNVAAFYHGHTNTTYVRSFDTARAGPESALGRGDAWTLLHECTHQILDRAAEGEVGSYFQSANLEGDVAENYWVVEGIATYFGSGGKARSVRKALARIKLPPLKEFCAYDYRRFLQGGGYHYVIAQGLCEYLIGKDRDRFVSFLREYYRGQGTEANFRHSFGARPEGIEKAFRGWLGK